MPNFPWSVRRDEPAPPDASLDRLLAGGEPGAGLGPVAEFLDMLRAAPAGDELTGEAAALAAFRGEAGAAVPDRRSRRRRRPMLTPLLSVKAAAAATAAALSLGGIATAAYTGSLPASVQGWAHNAIGAPPATPTPAPTPAHPAPTVTPRGPDATGSAAFGLCTAYAHAEAHGSASQRAVAFRNLAEAAGGSGKVAAYCATVSHPGASPTHPAHPSPKAHPSRSAHPSPGARPTPGPHPTGRPSPSPRPRPSHSPHPGSGRG